MGAEEGERDAEEVPADCVRKDSTSPATKSFVSHLARMSEWISPSVSRMMRPRIMYMDAAKKIGASNSSKLCMMYGPVVQFGVCLLLMARPM